jgi:transposase-like protein
MTRFGDGGTDHLEIKLRSKVVGAVPGPDSVICLIGSIFMDMNEEWITGNRYLNMREFELQVPESKLSICAVAIRVE